MIIWGWRAVMKTLGSGSFFCQREGGDRPYRHKLARRWFTLFFIPLIPLKELGDFVECSSCGATYDPRALDAKTATEIEDLATTAIRHVVVAMLLADGRVEDAERDAGLVIVNRFASRSYGPADLAADLEAFDGVDLVETLAELGSVLNQHGRESVLASVVYLAAIDGDVDARELELAREIGRALTMSNAHINGTISEVLVGLRGTPG